MYGPYPMPQQQMTWGPKEWGKFFKSMNGPDAKKKEDEEWDIIKRPKKKPRVLTWAQSFLLLTASFPFVGPLYYMCVLGSWELLKVGMATIIK